MAAGGSVGRFSFFDNKQVVRLAFQNAAELFYGFEVYGGRHIVAQPVDRLVVAFRRFYQPVSGFLFNMA